MSKINITPPQKLLKLKPAEQEAAQLNITPPKLEAAMTIGCEICGIPGHSANSCPNNSSTFRPK